MCYSYYVTEKKKLCFSSTTFYFFSVLQCGVFSNFSPTQDIHPTLELKRPFHREMRRPFRSVSGHLHFGGYCLDLDEKQRKKKQLETLTNESHFLWWVKNPL